MIADTAYDAWSSGHATTRRGLPDPRRITRFPMASRVHPWSSRRMMSVAWCSRPVGASSAIHVAIASTARRCAQADDVSITNAVALSAQRDRHAVGKGILLGRLENERGSLGSKLAVRTHYPPRFVEPDRPGRDLLHDAGEKQMLGAQNARSERGFGIVGENGHRPLRDDRAVVVDLVDEVHGGPSHARARLEHCAMHARAVHPRSAEAWQQGGVHVDHAPSIGTDPLRRHEAKVARQHHE